MTWPPLMNSAGILAVWSARTFSFNTFWSTTGDTNSAVIQSPMGRLTPSFNMNRWQGTSRPRNGSRDPKAWKEHLLLSNHEESCRFSSPSLRLQSHPRKVEQRTRLAGRLRLSATSCGKSPDQPLHRQHPCTSRTALQGSHAVCQWAEYRCNSDRSP